MSWILSKTELEESLEVTIFRVLSRFFFRCFFLYLNSIHAISFTFIFFLSFFLSFSFFFFSFFFDIIHSLSFFLSFFLDQFSFFTSLRGFLFCLINLIFFFLFNKELLQKLFLLFYYNVLQDQGQVSLNSSMQKKNKKKKRYPFFDACITFTENKQ